MSDWNKIDRQELDRYITGNWGEDQFRDAPPTLSQRIATEQQNFGLRFSVRKMPHRNMEYPGGSTWRYQIWRDGASITATRLSGLFYQGSAHTDPPALLDVLSALIIDASTVEDLPENQDARFAAFCDEFGYERYTESPATGRVQENPQARRIYNACWKTANDLRAFFGDAYKDWLYNTENE